jgi:hypothetical protein
VQSQVLANMSVLVYFRFSVYVHARACVHACVRVRECECVFVCARWCSECMHARVHVVVCIE